MNNCHCKNCGADDIHADELLTDCDCDPKCPDCGSGEVHGELRPEDVLPPDDPIETYDFEAAERKRVVEAIIFMLVFFGIPAAILLYFSCGGS